MHQHDPLFVRFVYEDHAARLQAAALPVRRPSRALRRTRKAAAGLPRASAQPARISAPGCSSASAARPA